MPTDPFDPQLLSEYERLSRLYPALDLNSFRTLWQEAARFMDDALALGYEPHEVPNLHNTLQPPTITLIRPRRENRPHGAENEPSNVKKGPWGID
ncbi:MAG: hypothetical protein ABI779_05130 [Acidobacteriota bacterium]